MPITVGTEYTPEAAITAHIHKGDNVQFGIQTDDRYRLTGRDVILSKYPEAWELVHEADKKCDLKEAERLLRKFECFSIGTEVEEGYETERDEVVAECYNTLQTIRKRVYAFIEKGEEPWASIALNALDNHQCSATVLRALLDAEKPEDLQEALA